MVKHSKKTFFKVDGTIISFTESELSKINNSLFSKLAQDKVEAIVDEKFILIDRQSTHLQLVLDWINIRTLPGNYITLLHLLEEARFYNLEVLVDRVQNRLKEFEPLKFEGTYLFFADLGKTWYFYFTFREDGTMSQTSSKKKIIWGTWSYSDGLVQIQLEGKQGMMMFIEKTSAFVKCNATVVQGKYFNSMDTVQLLKDTASTDSSFGNIDYSSNLSNENVCFNIGGKNIQLERRVLEKFPDSLFARMHTLQGMKIDKDDTGAIVIRKEIEQAYLEAILSFMNDGKVPQTKHFRQQVLQEALFFGIDQYSTALLRSPQNSLRYGGIYVFHDDLNHTKQSFIFEFFADGTVKGKQHNEGMAGFWERYNDQILFTYTDIRKSNYEEYGASLTFLFDKALLSTKAPSSRELQAVGEFMLYEDLAELCNLPFEACIFH